MWVLGLYKLSWPANGSFVYVIIFFFFFFFVVVVVVVVDVCMFAVSTTVTLRCARARS